MNRELTRREKTLLLVLIVVVLVAGYCKLILIPINDQISSYRLNMEAEQTELDANQGKMAQMQKMQKAIDEIKAAGEKRTIPQYDNSGKPHNKDCGGRYAEYKHCPECRHHQTAQRRRAVLCKAELCS